MSKAALAGAVSYQRRPGRILVETKALTYRPENRVQIASKSMPGLKLPPKLPPRRWCCFRSDSSLRKRSLLLGLAEPRPPRQNRRVPTLRATRPTRLLWVNPLNRHIFGGVECLVFRGECWVISRKLLLVYDFARRRITLVNFKYWAERAGRCWLRSQHN